MRGPICGCYIQRKCRPIVLSKYLVQKHLGIVHQARRACDTGTAARLLIGRDLGLPDELLPPALAALDDTGWHEALDIARQVDHVRLERDA